LGEGERGDKKDAFEQCGIKVRLVEGIKVGGGNLGSEWQVAVGLTSRQRRKGARVRTISV